MAVCCRFSVAYVVAMAKSLAVTSFLQSETLLEQLIANVPASRPTVELVLACGRASTNLDHMLDRSHS